MRGKDDTTQQKHGEKNVQQTKIDSTLISKRKGKTNTENDQTSIQANTNTAELTKDTEIEENTISSPSEEGNNQTLPQSDWKEKESQERKASNSGIQEENQTKRDQPKEVVTTKNRFEKLRDDNHNTENRKSSNDQITSEPDNSSNSNIDLKNSNKDEWNDDSTTEEEEDCDDSTTDDDYEDAKQNNLTADGEKYDIQNQDELKCMQEGWSPRGFKQNKVERRIKKSPITRNQKKLSQNPTLYNLND
ncbi:hypothetical protein K7X08_022370 [Anisodus acutangulus]|uniref:Uncharacterized protein n=1 Tax=Anisodus acutangulus TaxID=402998 RepID=A0A9Q1MHK4_9SOLA|nr:hypothetical protein K7X08_022370 [Anisodus acutangulus]